MPPPTRGIGFRSTVMDKAEVARALQEYEDAMAELLTSVRARDGRSDFPLRQRLYTAKLSV
jgi:hypothetical protein